MKHIPGLIFWAAMALILAGCGRYEDPVDKMYREEIWPLHHKQVKEYVRVHKCAVLRDCFPANEDSLIEPYTVFACIEPDGSPLQLVVPFQEDGKPWRP